MVCSFMLKIRRAVDKNADLSKLEPFINMLLLRKTSIANFNTVKRKRKEGLRSSICIKRTNL
jgi:hypothetical protein